MKQADDEAVLFDAGGTLLDVVRDPHVTAVEAVAHLGNLSATEFAAAIHKAVDEWRAADGRPEVEDLSETWVTRRALALCGFTGDIATAAQIMEDVFLSEGLEVFPEVLDVVTTLEDSIFGPTAGTPRSRSSRNRPLKERGGSAVLRPKTDTAQATYDRVLKSLAWHNLTVCLGVNPDIKMAIIRIENCGPDQSKSNT